MVTGPNSQPSCAVDQARESTPEPMTAVIMCALAVHTVPESKEKLHGLVLKPTQFQTFFRMLF
jgi:hypothetical protein